MSSSLVPETLKNSELCPQNITFLSGIAGKFQKNVIYFIYDLLLLVIFRLFILFLRISFFKEALLCCNLYFFTSYFLYSMLIFE